MAGIYPPWLADAARSTGYPVIEVAGWKTRGHGGFRVLEGVVGHHTGTAQTAAGDYPSLNIVTNGRADLAGPLCNYGLGRSGTIYVVAAGVAWHAGASAYAGFSDLNDEFVGIEAEHAGGILPWPGQQLDAYARLVGAICTYIRRPATRYCSHRTCALPAGRKPDPKNIPDDWMQAAAARAMTGAPVTVNTATTTGDDDMDARQAAQLDTLLAQVTGNMEPWKFDGWPTWTGGTGEKITIVDYLRRANVETRAARNEIKALRDEVAALRSTGATGGLSDADVARIAAAVAVETSKRMQA